MTPEQNQGPTMASWLNDASANFVGTILAAILVYIIGRILLTRRQAAQVRIDVIQEPEEYPLARTWRVLRITNSSPTTVYNPRCILVWICMCGKELSRAGNDFVRQGYDGLWDEPDKRLILQQLSPGEIGYAQGIPKNSHLDRIYFTFDDGRRKWLWTTPGVAKSLDRRWIRNSYERMDVAGYGAYELPKLMHKGRLYRLDGLFGRRKGRFIDWACQIHDAHIWQECAKAGDWLRPEEPRVLALINAECLRDQLGHTTLLMVVSNAPAWETSPFSS